MKIMVGILLGIARIGAASIIITTGMIAFLFFMWALAHIMGIDNPNIVWVW